LITFFTGLILYMGACLTARPREQSIDINDIEQSAEPLEVDNIWENFEFIRVLDDRGCSSKVLLVKDSNTQREYALKVMDSQYQYYFEREFEVLKRLHFRNIVKVYNAYIDKAVGKLYICLEYCSGRHLCDRLTERGSYTEGIAAKSVKDLLLALKHVHDLNVIHRDVKLENLVFQSEHSNAGLKLLDFGLAEYVDDPEELCLPAGGTPFYMAPEVIPNGREIRKELLKKSDMWALGVCVFFILNGSLPFWSEDRSELFQMIKHENPLQNWNENLSLEAKAFVSKLLEKDVEKRVTAEEALQEPWIVKSGTNDNAIVGSTVEALRLFYAKYSFHRALQKLAAQKVTKYDREYFKQLFDRFDLNQDGKISKGEFVTELERMMNTNEYDNIEACFNSDTHEELSNKEKAVNMANEIMKHADDNKDQMISWEEFQYAIARFELRKNEHKIHAVFSALDRNRDGYISTKELKDCLQIAERKEDSCDMKLPESPGSKDEFVVGIVKAFKNLTHGSGLMNFDEFKNLLKDQKSLGPPSKQVF